MRNPLIAVASAVLFACWASFSLSHSIDAAEPEPKQRTFMILEEADFINVDSELSQFIVTHAGPRTPDGVQSISTVPCAGSYATPTMLFPGTTWYVGGYITNVTADGPTTLYVYWLDEIPPSGAIAYTGLVGNAEGREVWMRPATSSDCANWSGKMVLYEGQGVATAIRRQIVTGWFSR